ESLLVFSNTGMQAVGAARTIPNSLAMNGNLIVGPTPNTYAAIGALGTPFDLQVNGFLNMQNAARTIQVNCLSTNGLICNCQTPQAAANGMAGSIVRGATAAAAQPLTK